MLDALYAAGEIRADVAQAYPDVGAIEAGDLLVSYTAQVPATDEQCFALRRYLEHGGPRRVILGHHDDWLPGRAGAD